MMWTDLSKQTTVAATAGSAPGPRAYHGVEAIGGIVYVFGGWSVTGKPCTTSVLLSLHFYPNVSLQLS